MRVIYDGGSDYYRNDRYYYEVNSLFGTLVIKSKRTDKIHMLYAKSLWKSVDDLKNPFVRTDNEINAS